jgi:hypothetical protein
MNRDRGALIEQTDFILKSCDARQGTQMISIGTYSILNRSAHR